MLRPYVVPPGGWSGGGVFGDRKGSLEDRVPFIGWGEASAGIILMPGDVHAADASPVRCACRHRAVRCSSSISITLLSTVHSWVLRMDWF